MSLQRHVLPRSGSAGTATAPSTVEKVPALCVDDLRTELQTFADGALKTALTTALTDLRSQVKEDFGNELLRLSAAVASMRSNSADTRRSRRFSEASLMSQQTHNRPPRLDIDASAFEASASGRSVGLAAHGSLSPASHLMLDRQNSHTRRPYTLRTYEAEPWEVSTPVGSLLSSPRRGSGPRRSSVRPMHVEDELRSYYPLMGLSTVTSEGALGINVEDEEADQTPAVTRESAAEEEPDGEHVSAHASDSDADSIAVTEQQRCGPCRVRVRLLVESPPFEYVTGILVVLNALALGLEVDCSIARCYPHLPQEWFKCIDGIFCMIFTIELFLRLFAYGGSYFSRSGWQWNVFDLAMVIVQILDQVRYWVFPDAWLGSDSPSSQLVRLIRLIRVARIYRVIRLFKELHVIVSSMASAAGSLAWSLLLQVVTGYVWGLAFLQIVSSSENFNYDEDLHYWFGSLGRSMLTMFECVLSGASWDAIVSPLMREVSPLMGVVFVLYIAVTLFAMMNLVTGLFVAEVTNKVREDKDESLARSIRELFRHLSKTGDNDIVTKRHFLHNLKSEAMQTYLKSLDVHPSEASLLFDVLDVDGDGVLKREEMLSAFLRLRGPAKSLDIAILRKELADVMSSDTTMAPMQGESSFQSWQQHLGASNPLAGPPEVHRQLSASTTPPQTDAGSRQVSPLLPVPTLDAGSRQVSPQLSHSGIPETQGSRQLIRW